MSLVAHKYTPAEMSVTELESTFAAREHTLDFLLKSLRDQIHSGTLSSFVLTGPRGAGKSTLIHMVDLRIQQDAELNSAWMPVVFPEEQFNVASLRDLLAAALETLASDGNPAAQSWLNKAADEANDEQSLQLAITGLREIARQSKKRLVLFVENIDRLLEESLDNQMKGTFRRLLMSEPFMMVIGSAVHMFDSLKKYDEAFFNYFEQVPLDRLRSEQVSDLLRKRAEFDSNQNFLRDLPQLQAKIRTLVHLTGGNPRLVLMLYELLSERKVNTIIAYLRRLVDELTPLLKDEMERLPPQQQKIIDALMKKGGTAQPTELAELTRLKLNAVNAQLKRLKEAQIVEVLGGGKGRAANYTVPDKLFAIWYQMRYLSQNRRRIELFVEVLRVWYEEDERLVVLKQLMEPKQISTPNVLHDCAMNAEYFAASLRGTTHADLATELCIQSWLRADLREAAMAFADLSQTSFGNKPIDEIDAYTKLADWLNDHGAYEDAARSLDKAISGQAQETKNSVSSLVKRGFVRFKLKDYRGAIDDFTAAIELASLAEPDNDLYWARAVVKRLSGDIQGSISDFTLAIEQLSPNEELYFSSLNGRAEAKAALGDTLGAVKDYDSVITLSSLTPEQTFSTLMSRAKCLVNLKDKKAAIRDYTNIINSKDANNDRLATAFILRGDLFGSLDNFVQAINDFTSVIEMKTANIRIIAQALFRRAVALAVTNNEKKAVLDCDSILERYGQFEEAVSAARIIRGMLMFEGGDLSRALEDVDAAIKGTCISKEWLLQAMIVRGSIRFKLGELQAALGDFKNAFELGAGTLETTTAAELVFGILWNIKEELHAKDFLRSFAFTLNKLSDVEGRESSVQFLNKLAARPNMKSAWPTAWRVLAETLRPGIKETLKFLEPICAVLEGKNRAVLDSLPPEQREFALGVLKKFETKLEVEPKV